MAQRLASPRALAIAIFLLAAAGTCFLRNAPPSPLSAASPPDVFSAERAMAYVRRLAAAPHPVGTPEHDRVRDDIVAELTRLGAAPTVQRTTGVTPLYQVAGAVENIVARVNGTSANREAVLLAAHYDSVPAGPGAGDDTSGVAVLLETMRAVLAGAPLRNDLIFLFSDGEEEGMLGASAFVAEHPWAKDVRVVANFEARGTGGVSQLFETSPGNGPLVATLARAVPHARGSSLAYEVYKRMPNDTDLTVLKKGGAAAMNFAFIGQWEAYHTPLDNAARLDHGSLQQHGESALGVARSLGQSDLAALRGDDDVFFNVLGTPIVHYPSSFGLAIASIAAIAWIGALALARRAGKVTWDDVALGALAQLATLIALMGIAFGFAETVSALHTHWLWEGDVLREGWYSLALCALLLAAWSAMFRWMREKIRWPGLLLGGALIVLALALVTTRWLPGGAFLFVWPLLAMLLAAAVASWRSDTESPRILALLALLALPPVALLAPLLAGLHEALGFGPPSAVASAIFMATLLLATSPILDVLFAASGPVVPRVALAVAVVGSIRGALEARYSPTHPKPSMVAYALDTARNDAKWACYAERTDRWTAQFLGDAPERGKLTGFYPDWLPFPLLLHDAPVLPIAPPSAVLVDQSTTAGTRTLELSISSPRHARTLTILAPGADVLESSVDGKPLGRPSDARWNTANAWALDFANPPPPGIAVKLRVRGAARIPLTVIDRSSGLPAVPGTTFAPRPADSMPIHTGDQTMVLARFEF